MTSKDLVLEAKEQARAMVERSVAAATQAGALPQAELPPFVIEIPGDATHGDFAANVAMVGAKVYRLPPRKVAGAVLEHLDFSGSWFARAEIAGPGFLNFFLKPEWFPAVLRCIERMGGDYGRTDHGGGESVMVEFVSANPTGPMHMGNARGGAIGDVLAAALDAAGYRVTREFYINDAGNQIEKFGISLEARYLQLYKGEQAVPFPEDGYQGEDITRRAREYADLNGDKLLEASQDQRRQALIDYALPRNIAGLEEDLRTYRIVYDRWFRESALHGDGTVQKVIGMLGERGLTYEKDGAVWYKATEFGGEKDEVLVRQNGNATYFAADIAYHYNKFEQRGIQKAIDVWGADHHGHVARLKGAMDALGLDGSRLDIVLMQLVRLMKDGEPYRMSKRSGKSITLTDLLEEVPIDAARFFFNMNAPGSAMDFDLSLAVKTQSENPVYYVKYAHARICSIIRVLREEDGVKPRTCIPEELLLLSAPEETALIRHLSRLPGEIVSAATRNDPAALTHYVIELATLFHKFYHECRVRGERESLQQARLSLCLCARTTIANVLALLKVTAPESM